ncbi:hypothetical protein [Selenomonas sp. AB3002]|uniref:hypothetical protein n=1 Tax=Selenomonas sp. AB3002 TaxID=1392502 RepID=UPI000495E64E
MRKATITHNDVSYSMTDKNFVRNGYGAIRNSREKMALDEHLTELLNDVFSNFSGLDLWHEVNAIWIEARLTHSLN